MPRTIVCLTSLSWLIAKRIVNAVREAHPNSFAIAKSSKNKVTSNNTSMYLLLVFAFITWGWHEALAAETIGQQYRRLLAQKDARCRQDKIGPYLDVADPEYRDKARLTNCDVLEIKAFDLATILATAEGEFAYSIKLPSPLDKPRVHRHNFRSSDEYFAALCEKEAGDFSLKTIRAVDGIAVLRVSPAIWRSTLGSFSEESNGTGSSAEPESRLLLSTDPYLFVERPLRPDEKKIFPLAMYLRFRLDPNRPGRLRATAISELSARYGYTWRGTPAYDDRENGIFGGELIVLDLKTSEVIAVRREFSRDDVNATSKDRISFLSIACRNAERKEYIHLIKKVLTPVD